MAERISAADAPRRYRGAPRIYPWDAWMDGSMWHLRQGIDYRISTRDFRNVVYNMARRTGFKAHTRVVDYGLVVTFLRDNPTGHQDAERIRYFAAGSNHQRIYTFTQAEIDEDPLRVAGMTEMQLVAIEEKAA